MKIAIIPARGGSKRIKNKNIHDFLGKPLIYYSLKAAQQSNLFDKIHVSTDSEMIKSTVESLGFPVDFMRDSSLADDHTGVLAVLRWVLTQYIERGEDYKTICLILPTAALIEASDLIDSYKLFCRHQGRYAILPVGYYAAPIEWAYQKLTDNRLKACQPGMFATRSQDLEKKYYDSGTFVWFNKSRILSNKAGDEDFIGYPLARHKAIDIDDMDDLQFARILKIGLEHINDTK